MERKELQIKRANHNRLRGFQQRKTRQRKRSFVGETYSSDVERELGALRSRGGQDLRYWHSLD